MKQNKIAHAPYATFGPMGSLRNGLCALCSAASSPPPLRTAGPRAWAWARAEHGRRLQKRTLAVARAARWRVTVVTKRLDHSRGRGQHLKAQALNTSRSPPSPSRLTKPPVLHKIAGRPWRLSMSGFEGRFVGYLL